MGVVIKHSGNFNKVDKFLERMKQRKHLEILEKYAILGVAALASATPVDTGKTASSWGYEIRISGGSYIINFTNSNVVDGVPIALVIQYGHGTRNGGYVQGRDYINPAIKPIFDDILREVWKEVCE